MNDGRKRKDRDSPKRNFRAHDYFANQQRHPCSPNQGAWWISWNHFWKIVSLRVHHVSVLSRRDNALISPHVSASREKRKVHLVEAPRGKRKKKSPSTDTWKPLFPGMCLFCLPRNLSYLTPILLLHVFVVFHFLFNPNSHTIQDGLTCR